MAVLLTLSSYSDKKAGIPDGWIKTGNDPQKNRDVLTLLGLAIVIWRDCLFRKQHLVQCSPEAKTGHCVLKVYSLVAAMHLFTIVEKVRRLEEDLGHFRTKISEYLIALPVLTQGNSSSNLAIFKDDPMYTEFTQLRKHKDFVEWLEKPTHLRAEELKLDSMYNMLVQRKLKTKTYNLSSLKRLVSDIRDLENEFALLSTPEIVIACTTPSFVMLYNEGVHRFTSVLINSAINDDDLKEFSQISIDLNHPQQSNIKSEAYDILRNLGNLGGYNHTQLFTEKEKSVLQNIKNAANSNSNANLTAKNKAAKALSLVVENLQVVSNATNTAFNAICMPKRSALELMNAYNDLFSVQVCGFFFIFSISYKPSHISRK